MSHRLSDDDRERVRRGQYARIDHEAADRVMNREWRAAVPRERGEGDRHPVADADRLARNLARGAVMPGALAVASRMMPSPARTAGAALAVCAALDSPGAVAMPERRYRGESWEHAILRAELDAARAERAREADAARAAAERAEIARAARRRRRRSTTPPDPAPAPPPAPTPSPRPRAAGSRGTAAQPRSTSA